MVLPPITSLDDVLPRKGAAPPAPTVATVMSVTLSSDARVVDDAVAGLFLQTLREYLQNPQRMMNTGWAKGV